jgi:hypothetical protein
MSSVSVMEQAVGRHTSRTSPERERAECGGGARHYLWSPLDHAHRKHPSTQANDPTRGASQERCKHRAACSAALPGPQQRLATSINSPRQ